MRDLQLLADVVAFKQRYYSSTWARYDLARPGSFRLFPNEIHIPELKRDYVQMASMLLGEPTPFDEILKTLRILEAEINR